MNGVGVSGRNGRRRPMAEINVIPYIDVCLVLLIIFMVTAPMLQSGVEVDLPKAEAKTIETKDSMPIILSIKADGRLFVDLDNTGDVEVSDMDLPGKLVSARQRDADVPILIRGDEKVDYGRVVAVMAAIKQAGIPSVGLMTRPPDP